MQIHILNGDALKQQFPGNIKGEKIVARLCLVDGPVEISELDTMLQNRAVYIEQAYHIERSDYHQNVIPEVKKVSQLQETDTVHLWFEDDLFCQVNLWFIAFLLAHHSPVQEAFLIRPSGDIRYGFGGMSEDGLIQAFQKKQLINEEALEALSQLWEAYVNKAYKSMLQIANRYTAELPFLEAAVQAEADRHPLSSRPSKPEEALLNIIKGAPDKGFGHAFRTFHEQLPIYGFGDLQVKRMYDKLINN